jgi:hypothetical protein
MTPKEFLKPTWKKIILFLIIFIVFIPFLGLRTESSNLIILPIAIYLITSIKSNYSFESINYLSLILGIISSYLISSFFIMWITLSKKKNDKLHNKKRK